MLPGKFFKLYDHLTKKVAVSPEVCKVAVNVAYDERDPGQFVRILDFCRSRDSALWTDLAGKFKFFF